VAYREQHHQQERDMARRRDDRTEATITAVISLP
jgi:hypothetical protein